MCTLPDGMQERLGSFAQPFHHDFRRRDQSRWLAVYLQGLLTPGGRKNIETVARSIELADDLEVDDVPQALQNFINQSPWDERRLWRRLRNSLIPVLAEPDGVYAIVDVAFPKQGQQSVGVHRQRCPGLGRKINCQLAVSICHVGADGCRPLALRLYLPRHWATDDQRLDEAGVPPEFRVPRSKREIALDLLEELRAEGLPRRVVVAGTAYGAAQDFRDSLGERGWSYIVGVNDDLPDEASLQALVEETPIGPRRYAVAALPANVPAAAIARLWSYGQRAEAAYERMKEELGLDHFEGRSWRGFHHHACLVALAKAFLVSERRRTEPGSLVPVCCGKDG
jgi:SRSO17 transposase